MIERKPDKDEAARWLAESRQAVLSINLFLEKHGLLADKLRNRPQIPASEDERG